VKARIETRNGGLHHRIVWLLAGAGLGSGAMNHVVWWHPMHEHEHGCVPLEDYYCLASCSPFSKPQTELGRCTDPCGLAFSMPSPPGRRFTAGFWRGRARNIGGNATACTKTETRFSYCWGSTYRRDEWELGRSNARSCLVGLAATVLPDCTGVMGRRIISRFQA
jgi:hypothetical protein